MINNENNPSNFVWIPDKIHCWYPAIIIEHDKVREEYTVETVLDQTYYHNINKHTIAVSKTHPIDPSHQLDLDNICLMNNMHEAPLLDLLRRRFFQSKIYTFSGNILISLNPYRIINGLYDNPKEYLNLSLNAYSVSNTNDTVTAVISDNNTNSPHVYSIANSALSELISTFMKDKFDSTNQFRNHSVVISGESGAGKTENSKHVINFLILANNSLEALNESHNINTHKNTFNILNHNNDNKHLATDNLKSILLHGSIILESFGNSKTVRNDNSSRFGKYIKLVYQIKSTILMSNNSMNCNQNNTNSTNKLPILSFPSLVSSKTETFLLEKSRLVMVGLHERNYHIFYQLIRGLPIVSNELSIKLKLNLPVDDFLILIQGNCTVIRSIEADIEDFSKTYSALQSLHCSVHEIENICGLLSCIVHMGNITCHEEEQTNHIELVCKSIELEYLAELLGLQLELFVQALTTQRVVIMKRTSIKLKYLTILEIKNNVSALMKWIYNRLFSWLVRKINHAHSINSDLPSTSTDITDNMSNSSSFIGILDIFGFEILNTNSFEQLCINFTNERLQQQFNEYVFSNEQQMYKLEGLNWDSISYRDNQHVIDLISGSKPKQGLLLLLEEQGMLNRAPDDIALVKAFNTMHEPIGAAARLTSAYQKSKFGNNGFVIKHFAGDVNYTIDGFLLKNNDALQEDLLNLLKTSSNVFLCNALDIGELVPDGPGYLSDVLLLEQNIDLSKANTQETLKKTVTTGKKMASSSTVSIQFRAQLDNLLTTLKQTKPHYIKCIKSNSSKEPNKVDSNLVMDQLRYSGVLEVVRIRREGFPIRMKFIDFYRNYEIFATGKPKEIFPGSNNCFEEKQQLQCCSLIASMALLPDQYQIGHTLIFLRNDGLQALELSIKKLYSTKVTKIQSLYKSLFMKRKYKKMCLQIILCQSIIRRFTKYNLYKRIRASIIIIQEKYLSKLYRERFLIIYAEILKNKRLKRIIKIQKTYRGYKVRCIYRKLLLEIVRNKKCIIIQKYYRRYQAIKVYNDLCYKLLQLRNKSAIKIQSKYRCYQTKKKFKDLKLKAILIQLFLSSKYRSKIQLIKYNQALLAIKTIQKYWNIYRHKSNVLWIIIKIQSLIRRYNIQNVYKFKLKSIIILQSFIRKLIARQNFIVCRLCILAIQTNIRRYISRRSKIKRLHSIILIQKMIRGILCRKYIKQLKLNRILASRKIQTFYRRFQNNKNNNMKIAAAIKIQSRIRSFLIQKQINYKFLAIIFIQSYFRMSIMIKRYKKSKYAINKLQSMLRMHYMQRKYIRTLKAILKLQATLRKSIQFRKYHNLKFKIRFLICYIKYWIYRRKKHIRKDSKALLYRNILKYIRKKILFLRLNNLHQFLMSPQLLENKSKRTSIVNKHESIHKNKEIICMKYHVNLKYERYQSFEFCSIYQSAIIGGNVGLFQQLNPEVKDMFAISSKGRNAMHFLALNPNKNMLNIIKSIFAGFKYNKKNIINRILEEEEDQDSIHNKEQVNELKEALISSVGNDLIMKGWLKKKRDSYLYQKRYVILTEDYLIYYINDTSLHNPRFAIPLNNVTMRRITTSKDPIFEISSPFMADKKHMFGSNSSKKAILFLADSEKSLQEWLKPLKVLTGMTEDGLRSKNCTNPPPLYINLLVLQLWVSSIDINGNTSLHILCYYQIHHDILSPMNNNKHILSQFKQQNDILDSKQAELISKFACWLIENGCPINQQNKDGHTALHLVLLQSSLIEDKINKKIIYFLIFKGADIFTLKDKNNLSVMDIINTSDTVPLNLKVYLRKIISIKNQMLLKQQVMNCNFNPKNINKINNKLKGYSYLSFYFTDSVILNVQHIKDIHDYYPCITLSVYSSNNKVLEQEYIIYHPILSSINVHTNTSKFNHYRMSSHRWDLHWGSYWHMQTPLENLEANSYILIKFYLKHENLNDHSLVYWTRYLINTDTIDTTYDEVIPFQVPTSITMAATGASLNHTSYNFNNMKFMLTNPIDPHFPLSDLIQDPEVSLDNQDSMKYAGNLNYILVDCILHQRDRTIDIKEILNQ